MEALGKMRMKKEQSEHTNNEYFDNREFWNTRYRDNPDLGSGIGSRGTNMRHKRAIISQYLNGIRPRSILDVGCGDHEVLSGISFDANYHGIDISSEIIDINTRKYLDRKFSCVDFSQIEDTSEYESDVVFCLEVLIHQHREQDYKRVLNKVVQTARLGGLVSGYVSNPRPDVQSEIIAWHEPITETLKSFGMNNVSILEYSLESSCLAFVSFSSDDSQCRQED
jgi:2-polyprenyl-3-methyl-5-hydroxy-6-metoxy-1,4-benzoquinol methylase